MSFKKSKASRKMYIYVHDNGQKKIYELRTSKISLKTLHINVAVTFYTLNFFFSVTLCIM